MVLLVLLVLLGAWVAPGVQAAPFELLHSFAGGDGETPAAALVQGSDGALHGVAAHGGDFAALPPDGPGVIFRKAPGSPLQVVHRFRHTDGSTPNSLLQARDGFFYGTTSYGGPSTTAGAQGSGTIFRVDPAGGITTLYEFTGGPAGAFPRPIVQGLDGAFYGTALGGVEIQPTQYGGFVFRFDPATGEFRRLYQFRGPDGRTPSGPLFPAADGYLYGTTERGGASSAGTVYKVDAQGNFVQLHSLTSADGSGPKGGVIEASDGNFYGTTEYGTYYGTIFRMDPTGNYEVVHRFDSYTSTGSRPRNGLIQARDGFLYGTTSLGGLPVTSPDRRGVVYRMDLAANVTVLHTFRGPDGSGPWASVIEGWDGSLYGTTVVGGEHALGTVFRVVPGAADMIFESSFQY